MKPASKLFIATAMSFFLLLLLETSAKAQGFNEQFNSPTLDPAWQVVQYTGARVYGFSSPANRFSLPDNPGHLRYYLDPMTHWDGFTYNFQTSYSLHSCCNHDPGLELRRVIEGENWLLEAKASYFLPYTNGRGLALDVYFGNGGIGTFSVQFQRGRDVNQNFLRTLLAEKTGADPWNYPLLEDIITGYPIFGPDYSTFYFRLKRSGGELTAMWSEDGVTWNTAFSRNLGTQLDGLEQRVVIAGLSWFSTGGSFADWDYISVTPTVLPPEEQVQAVCDDLQAIADANPGTPLADKIEDALAKCQIAFAELTKSPPDRQAAAGAIEGAVGELEAAVASGLLAPEEGNELMDDFAGVARQIAQEAIDEAIAGGGDPVKIAEAQDLLAQGDARRGAGAYKDAAGKYKDALAKAEGA